jgi:hypothetical protein
MGGGEEDGRGRRRWEGWIGVGEVGRGRGKGRGRGRGAGGGKRMEEKDGEERKGGRTESSGRKGKFMAHT